MPRIGGVVEYVPRSFSKEIVLSDSSRTLLWQSETSLRLLAISARVLDTDRNQELKILDRFKVHPFFEDRNFEGIPLTLCVEPIIYKMLRQYKVKEENAFGVTVEPWDPEAIPHGNYTVRITVWTMKESPLLL